MVNELRKKLVRVCGISALALLAVIYACIYILSARQLNGAMDMLADRISENGGSFPEYSAGEQEDMGACPRIHKRRDQIQRKVFHCQF